MHFRQALLLLLTVFIASNASAQNLEQVALDLLEQEYKKYNLTQEDATNYVVSDSYVSKHNGLSHVYIKQTYKGIPIHNAIFNVNVLPDKRILYVGNRFVKDVAAKVNTSQPSLQPEQAVQSLVNHHQITQEKIGLELKENKGPQEKVFTSNVLSKLPIPVQLVYQPMPDNSVRLAWNVFVYTLDGENGYDARIDAVTGEVLNEHNHVLHCDFDAVSHNHAEHTAHSGNCMKHKAVNESLGDEEKQGGGLTNSYNVFPLTVESPNHGSRAIVTDPSYAPASPYGWHDTNGVPGNEYTITNGNNTHTYHDIFNTDASYGDEPDGGSTLDFDFPLDLTTNRPYTYVDAAVTNLFYWCNIMHDVWYAYGFDEPAGNFQVNNYGNGGLDGDQINAEAMDGSGRNNANFFSLEDGTYARIQMYLWTQSPLPSNFTQELTVSGPSTVAGQYEMAFARFGPKPKITVSGQVVEANDGTAPTNDACQPLQNAAALNGKIAMVEAGTCQHSSKCLKAQNAGAIAVIVCNNLAGVPYQMGNGDFGDSITIPCIMINKQDCATLSVELANNLTASMEFNLPNPGPVGVTGDFDNVIIAHEYGHGISRRLAGGPAVSSCLSNFEQAGEGWSDWFGLVMTTDASNTPNERRGVATYAIGQPVNGTGIRNYPYTRDMSINPFTYKEINNPTVSWPHGVGSVFCTVLWDLYWDLVDVHGFDADFYSGTGGNNMAMQLVIDGLKIQPCNASFTDMRDAIIAADQANYNGINECLIWGTFARRGMGFQSQGPTDESYVVAPVCIPSLKIEKTATFEVEAAGVITYTFDVSNDLSNNLTGVTITDTLPSTVTYIQGTASCAGTTISGNIVTIPIGGLSATSSTSCSFDVYAPNTPFSTINFEDDMEAGANNWSVVTGAGMQPWTLNSNNPNSGTNAWFIENSDTISDHALEFASTTTLTGAKPAISFWHSYDTEPSKDGGVVEMTIDNGITWIDLGPMMVKNGYNGNVQVDTNTVVSGRNAFTGQSNGYVNTLVDLTDWVGAPIRLRFWFGTNNNGGGNGWYIDDVRILNLETVINRACVSSDQGDFDCDEAETIILHPLTSVEDLPILSGVTMYPNPTDNQLTVLVENRITDASLNLMSVDGRTLISKAVTEGLQTVDVSQLAAGLYFAEIVADEGVIVKKIIVE